MDMEVFKASVSLSKKGKQGCIIAFVLFLIWNVLVGIYHSILGVFRLSGIIGFIFMGLMVAYTVGLTLTPVVCQSLKGDSLGE